jgi:hypothetical protein
MASPSITREMMASLVMPRTAAKEYPRTNCCCVLVKQ